MPHLSGGVKQAGLPSAITADDNNNIS